MKEEKQQSGAEISDPVELDTPIVRGEETISELRIRKPDSGAMRGLTLHDLTRLDVDTLYDLLPRITIPPIIKAEAMALDPADLLQLGGEVGNFFAPRATRPASRTG